ncbi:MAG: HD domain-containing protein, partial [Actinomycetota bacterium]|nr:HD domain-containing protein [Actinomycetota bacterium]
MLARVTESSADDMPATSVVAVGGYGRGELNRHSDVDLLVVTRGPADTARLDVARILYPLWDAGFQVGHGVMDAAAAVERGVRELDAATSLLTARLVAGDEDVFAELLDRRARWLRKDNRRLIRRIVEATAERHRRVDRAGWVLAPDVKNDLGGLRDVHALDWLRTIVAAPPYGDELVGAAELMLVVREALHAESRRKQDRLRLDLQARVADRLGMTHEDAVDDLIARVHTAARVIEYDSSRARDAIAQQVLGGPRRSGWARRLGPSVRADDGLLHLEERKPTVHTALSVLVEHARTGYRIARPALDALESAFDRPPLERWDARVLRLFLDLMQAPHATASLELLDHLSGWSVLLPELNAIRGRAQHDPYHRYTVDAHSFLTVGEVTDAIADDEVAAGAAAESGDLAPLYVAALLHDVGKGSGDDHSVAGEAKARAAATRMGMTEPQVADVAALVRHHLLLSDTATRRDLDDGSVIERTAKSVATTQRLRYLYILSVADGRATGPAAWSDWKATLVRELYRKTFIALETGRVPVRTCAIEKARQAEAYEPSLAGRVEGVLATLPPSYLDATPIPDMVDEIRLLLQAPSSGEVRWRRDDDPAATQAVITICARDRPGTLARAAGVFALNRISVLRAYAYSTSDGFALERFVVDRSLDTSWSSFERDLAAAYSGRLAVEAHVERKANDYR